MMILEELERLSIDMFLLHNKLTMFSKTNMSIDIAKQYISYLKNNDSTDQRRQYMFSFIIIATEFRRYWKAVRCGDRIVMEEIQNIWIGVHLLSGYPTPSATTHLLHHINYTYWKAETTHTVYIRTIKSSTDTTSSG